MFYLRLKELRETRSITQSALAQALNVSRQSVSNWENGNIVPSVGQLIRIAKYFSVSTDYMLGLDDRRFLEVYNLSDEELEHIQTLIRDLENRG